MAAKRPLTRWHFLAFVSTVAIASALLQFPARFIVPWDLATYLAHAKLSWSGASVQDADLFIKSRHGYILLLTALYALPGLHLLNVAIMQTAFCALLACGIGCLAWRLYGALAAWVAAALWLSSSDLLVRLPNVIDPVWPPFVFAGFLLLWRPRGCADSVSLLAAVCAGALAGAAITIKETTAPFLLFPLLLVLFRVVRVRHAALVGYFAAAGVAFLLVGVLASGTNVVVERGVAYGSGGSELLGWVQRELADAGGAGIGNALHLLVEALIAYVVPTHRGVGLLSAMPLLPLVGVALAWGAWKALFCRDRAAQFLLIAIVPCLPLTAVSGLMGLRPTQNLLLVGIGYVFSAGLIVHVATLLVRLLARVWTDGPAGSARRFAQVVSTLVLTVGVMAYDVAHAAVRFDRLVKRTAAYKVVTQGNVTLPELIVPGHELARWVSANVPQDDIVLVENVAIRYGLTYLLGPTYRFAPLPLENAGYTVTWPYYPQMRLRPDEPVDFLALSTPNPGQYLNVLIGAWRADLAAAMDRYGRPLVAISEHGYGKPLIAWLNDCEGYVRVAETPSWNRRNKISILAPSERPLQGRGVRCVDAHVLEHLDELAAHGPEAIYEWNKRLIGSLLHSEAFRSQLTPQAAMCPGLANRDVLLCF